MKVHLHQFLGKAGLFKTKKAVFDSINQKEVTVDGEVVKFAHYRFNPFTAEVKWKGKRIRMLEERVYIIMNKPEGYLCSKIVGKDELHGKKSIFELLQKDKRLSEKQKKSLFCVGRLDENATGIIIITNDGDLSYKLTNPKYDVEKQYKVLLQLPVTQNAVRQIQQGVEIELEENKEITKYTTKPARVDFLNSEGTDVLLTLKEGKKREIRRIFEKLGNTVIGIERVAVGGLKLDKIRNGEYIIANKEVMEKALFAISEHI